MNSRRGERVGWVVGWLGGFVWVVLLSVIFLVQQRYLPGVLGLLLGGVAVATITACAPWKHVETPYWKLMLPVYGVLACALGWAIWTAGGPSMMGLNRWSVFLVLPLLIPFWTVGRRRWSDSAEA